MLEDEEDLEVFNRLLLDVIECRKKSHFVRSFCQQYVITKLLSKDCHFIMAPSPASYVPVSGTELSDQMDFADRVKNVLFYIYSQIELNFYISPAYFDVIKRHFPPGTDLLSLELSTDIWLVRADFVFEFPRPTMPNIVYIGGFQSQEPSPLSEKPLKLLLRHSQNSHRRSYGGLAENRQPLWATTLCW
uniref:Uncharacterized protein n=1 Tax=Neogobius melanostomus TaxID=47308 RepID=A0A8C6TKB6_9GOBI